jgi:hypothetical protein
VLLGFSSDNIATTLSQKQPVQKGLEATAQLAEHLLSKLQVLSSNPSTTKYASKKQRKQTELLCDLSHIFEPLLGFYISI